MKMWVSQYNLVNRKVDSSRGDRRHFESFQINEVAVSEDTNGMKSYLYAFNTVLTAKPITRKMTAMDTADQPVQ